MLADENTGRDVTKIQVGRKNIRLMVASENLDGLVTLPIGIVQSAQGLGQFICDEHFIPPTLQIHAALPLMRMLRRLIELLADRCRTVARPKDLGSGATSGFSAEGIANAWFLHCVNSSLGTAPSVLIEARAPQCLSRIVDARRGAVHVRA